jgi:hypothetical protein
MTDGRSRSSRSRSLRAFGLCSPKRSCASSSGSKSRASTSAGWVGTRPTRSEGFRPAAVGRQQLVAATSETVVVEDQDDRRRACSQIVEQSRDHASGEVGSGRGGRPLGGRLDRDPGASQGRHDVLEEPRGVTVRRFEGEPRDRRARRMRPAGHQRGLAVPGGSRDRSAPLANGRTARAGARATRAPTAIAVDGASSRAATTPPHGWGARLASRASSHDRDRRAMGGLRRAAGCGRIHRARPSDTDPAGSSRITPGWNAGGVMCPVNGAFTVVLCP